VGLRAAGFAIAALVIATSNAAHADEGNRADKLFAEGRSLMEAARFDEACAKFAESQRAKPSMGTLLNLGLCNEKGGRLASAVEAYRDATLAATKSAIDVKRVALAKERIAALEPRVPRVAVALADESTKTTVSLGSRVLTRAELGAAVLVDPGELNVSATAEGYTPWQTRLTLTANGAITNVVVPKLEPIGANAAPPPPPPPVNSEPRPTPPPSGSSLVLPIALVGVSAVGFAAFGYFMITGQSDIDDLKGKCAPSCSDADVDPIRRKNLYGGVAIGIGAAAGVAALTVLLLRSGSAPAASALHPERLGVVTRF
jgi:hypothetical protein